MFFQEIKNKCSVFTVKIVIFMCKSLFGWAKFPS